MRCIYCRQSSSSSFILQSRAVHNDWPWCFFLLAFDLRCLFVWWWLCVHKYNLKLSKNKANRNDFFVRNSFSVLIYSKRHQQQQQNCFLRFTLLLFRDRVRISVSYSYLRKKKSCFISVWDIGRKTERSKIDSFFFMKYFVCAAIFITKTDWNLWRCAVFMERLLLGSTIHRVIKNRAHI